MSLAQPTHHRCCLYAEADSEEVATLSGSRQMLTVVARFMMLQVRAPAVIWELPTL
jgi:hypothetical protein